MKKKGAKRARAGTSTYDKRDLHHNEKIMHTHRKKGVKSKPVGTASMLTRAERGGGY